MHSTRPGLLVWISIVVLAVFYTMAVFASFVAPYDYTEQNRAFPHSPPSSLHMNSPSAWKTSVLYTYPLKLSDAITRKY